jgi:hypothetical protein
MRQLSSFPCIVSLILFTIGGKYEVNAAEEDKCATANQFICPTSCTGYVTDCLECNGYLNSGK